MLVLAGGARLTPRVEVGMETIARLAVQHSGVVNGATVALEVQDGPLRDGLLAALNSMEASVQAGGEGPADVGIAAVESRGGDLAPLGLRRLIPRMAPGGRLALIVEGGQATTAQGEAWGLVHPRVETDGKGTVVSGALREAVTSSLRKKLRGLGHGLDASVQIGRAGLTDSALEAVQAGVKRHGLLKVKLTAQCELDKNLAARELAVATGSQLIQRVGKTALIYRADVPLEPPTRKTGRRRSGSS